MKQAALIAILALLATAPSTPAAAIEVCRANALGEIVCRGRPTRGLPKLDPFRSTATGLGRVQSPLRPAPPGLISSERTNSFGDTILREGETPRPRPRICQADSFGNLRC